MRLAGQGDGRDRARIFVIACRLVGREAMVQREKAPKSRSKERSEARPASRRSRGAHTDPECLNKCQECGFHCHCGRRGARDRAYSLVYFVVDFDSQKDAVNFFGAPMQSTQIVFKGEHETGRSVGDTERSSIAALLNKTL